MITIPISNASVQEKINRSAHLSVGMDLIGQWTRDLAIPDGVVPLIAGGAIRDVFFKGTTPHDVDFFFGRDGITATPSTAGVDTKNNLMEWFEDNEIVVTSLSSEARAEYDQNGLFIDIVEFTYSGLRCQAMFHRDLKTANAILDDFPVMCRAMISPVGIHFVLTGYAAMMAPFPVVITSRDWAYALKKYPGQQVMQFGSSSEMVGTIAPRLSGPDSVNDRTITVPVVMGRMSSRPSLPSLSAFYSSSGMLKRSIRRVFGLGEFGSDLANIVLCIAGADWSATRRRGNGNNI